MKNLSSKLRKILSKETRKQFLIDGCCDPTKQKHHLTPEEVYELIHESNDHEDRKVA